MPHDEKGERIEVKPEDAQAGKKKGGLFGDPVLELGTDLQE